MLFSRAWYVLLNNLFQFKQKFLVSVGICVLSLVNWVKHCCTSGSCFLAWTSVSFKVNSDESYSFLRRISNVTNIYIYYQKWFTIVFHLKKKQKKPQTLQDVYLCLS